MPDTAADWDARLRAPDCSADERQAFDNWCRAAPENRRAFDELQDLLGALRGAADSPELRSMREAALNAAEPKRDQRKLWGAGWAAAAAVLAVGLAVVVLDQDSAVAPLYTYATSIGERSTTQFEDGSTAVLNTNTRLRLDFDGREREVTLLHGQALFDVAEDSTRPFVVVAGEQRITAIGTIFDVRYEGDDIQVTLVEGVVDVVADPALGTHLTGPATVPEPVRLTAGQVLKTTALVTQTAPAVTETDAERATIWRQGRVFFDDAPLSEAVAEMNRYSTVQIVIDNPALDRHRVNGMFRTGRQTTFVEALESYFPVTAVKKTNNRIVLTEQRGQ